MLKNRTFYTCLSVNPRTVVRVPEGVSIHLTEDEVLQWLLRRKTLKVYYEKKFDDFLKDGTLALASSSDLARANVTDFSDCYAVDKDGNLVSRNFEPPALSTVVSDADFKLMQEFTGFDKPYLIYSVGKTTVHVLLTTNTAAL